MKRIIILSTLLLSLCGHAQINPAMDSLVHQMLASNAGYVELQYHLMPLEVIPRCCYSIIYIMHGQAQPHPDNPRYESRRPQFDSLYYELHPKEMRIHNAVRNTCRALAREAKESYLWEFHHEGIDSIQYAITIRGNYPQWIYHTPYMRHFDKHNSLKYSYTPNHAQWWFDDPKISTSLPSTNCGQLQYEYIPDTIRRHPHPIDVSDYTERIKPVLNREGVEKHSFYFRCDSSLAVRHPEVKMQLTSTFSTTPPYDTEIFSTVYCIDSSKLAKTVVNELQAITMEYVKQHPHTACELFLTNDIKVTATPLLKCPLIEKDAKGREHEYCVFHIKSVIPDRYYIIITDTHGKYCGWPTYPMPYGWQTMKSWINGKVIHHTK